MSKQNTNEPEMAGNFIDSMFRNFPVGAVLIGDDIPARNQADASKLPSARPLALVLPRTTEEVSTVIRICNEFAQPAVVQGGMTGMAGGAMPSADLVAISLERMTGIVEIDVDCATITALAGTPLYQLQDAAKEHGLHLPIDLGARGSCSVGGIVSTNAGGHQVLRYGMTRNHVSGLEVVLPDGSILSSLKKITKDNTGYDWRHLIIGAEGTLGIVTKAVFSLAPAPGEISTALLGLENTIMTVKLLNALRQKMPSKVLAFEAMWTEFQNIAAKYAGTTFPFSEKCDVAVLIDAECSISELETVLAGIYDEGHLKDALIAQSEADRHAFWSLRESIYEFSPKMPAGPIFDISIPASRMDEAVTHFRKALPAIGQQPEWVLFGHLGDSNLHIQFGAVTDSDDAASRAKACIYEIVAEFDGSISAEHGIGLVKRDYLGYSRTVNELAFMRLIKQAVDPKNILNRGRIFSL